MIKPIKNVQKMKTYDPPTAKRLGKLRLDFNENTIGCSPKVIEALKNINPDLLSIYPEYTDLVKELASYLSVKETEVIATNGTDEAIHAIITTYIEEGDEMILPVPTFAMFKLNASIAGADIKEILYNKDLSFPIEKVLDAITERTKMIILVNPNNPTATSIDKKNIINIVEKAKNAVVFIDEAYYQYSGETSKDLIKKYDNVIVTQTFSKALGIAGLRLGYIISNEQVIKDIRKVLSPYSVNNLAVIAGIAAMKDKESVDDYVRQVTESRIYLEGELRKLGIKAFPSKANFLVADFGENCDLVDKKLREKDILVRNRSKYPLLSGCIRVGIGTKEQTKQLVDEIKKILRPETVLFDIDGVLVDVNKSYREAIKKTAEFFTKQEITPEEIQTLKEKGGYNNDWDLTEALIIEKGINIDKKEIIDKFQDLYIGTGKLIDNENWLLSKEILENLYKRYRLGIITGRPKEEAMYVLDKFGASEYFDVVIAMEDCPEGKEKPDPFSISLALEKIKGSNAVYIGDSIDDMKAAVSAGIRGIGVMPPGINSDKLRSLLIENKAEFVLNNINELAEALK